MIDLRTLYPLDLETVTASLRKTGRAVMVDESPGYGGVSAEIAASLQEAAFDYLDGPIGRVHAPHSPVPQSRILLEALLPGSGRVEAAVRTLLIARARPAGPWLQGQEEGEPAPSPGHELGVHHED